MEFITEEYNFMYGNRILGDDEVFRISEREYLLTNGISVNPRDILIVDQDKKCYSMASTENNGITHIFMESNNGEYNPFVVKLHCPVYSINFATFKTGLNFLIDYGERSIRGGVILLNIVAQDLPNIVNEFKQIEGYSYNSPYDFMHKINNYNYKDEKIDVSNISISAMTVSENRANLSYKYKAPNIAIHYIFSNTSHRILIKDISLIKTPCNILVTINKYIVK